MKLPLCGDPVGNVVDGQKIWNLQAVVPVCDLQRLLLIALCLSFLILRAFPPLLRPVKKSSRLSIVFHL